MKFAFFRSVTLTQGEQQDIAWVEFATGYLQTFHPQLTKDGPLYAGAIYIDDRVKREDSNVSERTAVIFDFDNKDCEPSRPEDHEGNLEGLTWAWHSSFSTTPEQPRWRLVLPLDRPCTVAEWPHVYAGAWALIGHDPAVDTGSADLSRAYYRPSYHPARKDNCFSGYRAGERVEVDYLLELAGQTTIRVHPGPKPLPTVPIQPRPQIKYDGRNDALKAQVAACLGKGKGVDETVKELVEFDATRHTPPLFSDPSENKGQADPWTNALRFVSSNIASINKRREAAGEPPQRVVEPTPKPALPTIWWRDREVILDTHDFVEGLLNEGAMSVVYGDSNVGKSFFMLDMALHVAMGATWHGREVEPGGVIYIAAEGGLLFQNRLEAFAQHYQVTDGDIPFATVPCGIDLRDPEADVDRLIQLIEDSASAISLPIKLVIIDTLARAMSGGNENSSEDMGSLVINTDKVRAKTRAHLSFIHHSGKDQAKGARGHSSLRAATDTEIELVLSDGIVAATATKQRDMEMGPVLDFSLKSIELGKNTRGKPITSCVILPAVSFGPLPNRKGLGKKQAQVLKEFERMHEAAEAELISRGMEPGHARISLEVWQQEMAELGLLGKNSDYHKQEFYRLKEALTERHLVTIEAGIAYPNHPGKAHSG